MPDILPPITVLIPTFNEQDFIVECVESLFRTDDEIEALEILIVDGGSTDSTRRKVAELANKGMPVKLINNPNKIVPSAMNIGIAQARYDTIVWVGAHAVYEPHYLANSARILKTEECASVGGVLTPIGKTRVGKAIAAATSSRFGVGNAKYRHAKTRQSVDTVFGGCFNKQDALKINGFDETWVRNQDYEFNYRLRSKIGKIILDPSIRCNYYCRETIGSLAKQYFNYGVWRFHTSIRHPNTFGFRQAAPIALVIAVTVSALIAFIEPSLGLICPLLYFTASLFYSTYVAFNHKTLSFLFLLPIIFATLHFSWAFGFIKSTSGSLIHNFFKINKA